VGDLVLGTEVCYLPTREICLAVRDDGMRKLGEANDILPEKFDNLLSCDIGERHYFYPLNEVVCSDQQESELRLRTGKRTYYVKPLLHEGPGTVDCGGPGLFEDGANL